MNEKQTKSDKTLPTKKQKELLQYIESFIAEYGYSPSYREIMAGLHYNSVATVALHVINLIKRGHLQKRDRSARSLEVASAQQTTKITSNQVLPAQEKWLVEKVEHLFVQLSSGGAENFDINIKNIQILINALRILGIEGAAQSFTTRLRDVTSATI